MTAPAQHALRIGEWRVEPALDQISRNGTTVKIEPRAMKVLVCLAENPGEVFSVDQLLDAVWKGVVVSPESVYQAVAGLRRALGDDPKNPTYIANVLRRGYRLIAPVAIWADPPPAAQAGPEATRKATAGWRWIAAAVAVVAIGYLVAHQVSSTRRAVHSATEPAVRPAGIVQESVAVMPFVDLSESKDQGYFADGLTEELINRLATVARLRVPAATSSFYFKGRQVSVADIAKALGVAYLLEGSVRKSGNALRISAELVRAENGYQVWSETFDRPLTDVFKVQDEITAAVFQVLKLSIVDHYTPRGAPTENIEAYTLYLRAQSSNTNGGEGGYNTAIDELHEAVKLDPQYADAWAELANTIAWKIELGVPRTPAACAEARAAAAKAIKLDSQLEEAHRAVGLIFQYCDDDIHDAEAAYIRAIELAPGRDDALRSDSWLMLNAGRLQQALDLGQRAASIDPLNPWNLVAVGDAQWRLGHLTEAEAAYRKAVELNPAAATLHALYANVLLSVNRPVEAVAEAEREPDPRARRLALPVALDAAGRKDDADREIAVLELLAPDDAGEIAVFYACRHDTDHAVEWLKEFAAKHKGEFVTLPNRAACFKNIEADPRYQSILRQMREDESRPPAKK